MSLFQNVLNGRKQYGALTNDAEFWLELEHHRGSAAPSLAEGLEETLTLHRLGVFALLGVSFKTNNCLESINALAEER